MINYFYDCYTILNKVYSQKTFVKQAISSTIIEEKNRALIIKTVYGVLDKDIEFSYVIKNLANQTPKLPIRTILKIAMYSIKYLNKKEYAVVKNAVELVKKLGKGGASGFVNAFLHKFISAKVIYPKDEKEYLSIKYSYPLFACKALIEDYGISTAKEIMSAENTKTTIVFYDENGEKYLKEKGVQFEKTPFDNVFNAYNFVRNQDYDKGTYTFQALGSVAICDVVPSCENLLDCCSAPGGKSIRLSYRIGQVTAWDVHEHRVNLIKEYATRMKRSNVVPMQKDSSLLDSEYVDTFDCVLIDAPCSGLGVLNDNPDIKLNRIEDDIVNLNKLQKSILSTVSNYVKIGGYLIYSTCSVLKRENIDIIKDFLSNNNKFEIQNIQSPLNHLNIEGTNQFLPNISGGLGFYVAKLKRVK